MDFSTLGLFGLFIAVFLSGSFVPFSADVTFVAFMKLYHGDVVTLLLVAIIGNWMGSMVTYLCGRLMKWQWLEKKFKIKYETLEKQKVYIDKYGVLLALVAWIPVFGQAVLLALGFYKCHAVPTAIILLAGITIRFLAWMLIL